MKVWYNFGILKQRIEEVEVKELTEDKVWFKDGTYADRYSSAGGYHETKKQALHYSILEMEYAIKIIRDDIREKLVALSGELLEEQKSNDGSIQRCCQGMQGNHKQSAGEQVS